MALSPSFRLPRRCPDCFPFLLISHCLHLRPAILDDEFSSGNGAVRSSGRGRQRSRFISPDSLIDVLTGDGLDVKGFSLHPLHQLLELPPVEFTARRTCL